VNLFDLADGSILNDANRLAISAAGMNLDAHLCHELLLVRELREPARLVDVVRHGLLAIHVFAELHRGHGHRRVHVIGDGDVDRVNGLLLVEQLAPVLINLYVGKSLQRVGLVQVHVRDSNEAGFAAARVCLECRCAPCRWCRSWRAEASRSAKRRAVRS
jgi:hypothetical protein